MQTKSWRSERVEKDSNKLHGNNLHVAISQECHQSRGRYAVDKVIETYRAVLRTITPATSFDETIQVMVSLGCYSSVKTRTELRTLFDTHIFTTQEGRCGDWDSRSYYHLTKDYEYPQGISDLPLECGPVEFRFQDVMNGAPLTIIGHPHFDNYENYGVVWYQSSEVHITLCIRYREILTHELAHLFIFQVARMRTLAGDEELQAETLSRFFHSVDVQRIVDSVDSLVRKLSSHPDFKFDNPRHGKRFIKVDGTIVEIPAMRNISDD